MRIGSQKQSTIVNLWVLDKCLLTSVKDYSIILDDVDNYCLNLHVSTRKTENIFVRLSDLSDLYSLRKRAKVLRMATEPLTALRIFGWPYMPKLTNSINLCFYAGY